ncbi:unnamed protein product [marine sediment metagenome]|uniref:Uncharacterized protein n=1 Tax=marine sediment metagenome TaxID=412755 RepID=X0VZA0_9ZZZZ
MELITKKKFFIVRVSEAEKESIRRAANRQGRTMSRYMLTLHDIAENAGTQNENSRK